MDLKVWETGIPGKEGVRSASCAIVDRLRLTFALFLSQTIWENAVYPVTLIFPDGVSGARVRQGGAELIRDTVGAQTTLRSLLNVRFCESSLLAHAG